NRGGSRFSNGTLGFERHERAPASGHRAGDRRRSRHTLLCRYRWLSTAWSAVAPQLERDTLTGERSAFGGGAVQPLPQGLAFDVQGVNHGAATAVQLELNACVIRHHLQPWRVLLGNIIAIEACHEALLT